MVAQSPGNPPLSKKPSLKKYKAPTPPQKVITEDNCESDKDNKENAVQHEDSDNDASDDCKQTKVEPVLEKPAPEKESPVVKRLAPKINGNVDRSSVLSKAAMFEAGSPKAKDPAEMSLRERKALFEKNKGAAIIPKAPFGLAPSVKTLHGDKGKLFVWFVFANNEGICEAVILVSWGVTNQFWFSVSYFNISFLVSRTVMMVFLVN